MANDNLLFMPATDAAPTDFIEKEAMATRVALAETGYSGLKIRNGLVYEELKKELTFPDNIITYKQMAYDSTIAAALSYFEAMMLKARWKVQPFDNKNEEDKLRAQMTWDMFNDMEHSWQDFIQEVASMGTYGFAPHEIVLRKRLRIRGSKYNDGLIGIRKLPLRGQDTVHRWIFTEDGRDLAGLVQKVQVYKKSTENSGSTVTEDVVIPREKFLLFRMGKFRGNPFGESPLKNCYFSWKYKVAVEEQEAIGLQRDLSGVPIAFVPPQIMSADATPEQKAQFEMWKNIVRNIHNNQQAGLVLPLIYDPDTKLPLYKFELMKNEGGKAYDTTKIKQYYTNAILTSLSADVLVLGQSGTGSYALGSMKNTMTAIAIEARLHEICNVINKHLIPLLAEYNDWPMDRLPTLKFEDLEATNLEELSKYLQRTASTGFLPRTHDVVNKVLDGLGLDPVAEDVDLDSILPESKSKAGQGMATAGDGTSTDPLNIDGNDNNPDNVG